MLILIWGPPGSVQRTPTLPYTSLASISIDKLMDKVDDTDGDRRLLSAYDFGGKTNALVNYRSPPPSALVSYTSWGRLC